MDLFVVKSKMVCGGAPYFIGIAMNQNEIRLGLIWWQVGINWAT